MKRKEERIKKLSFENTEKLYLGVTVTNTNDIHEKIKRRINMGNASYYLLEKILLSRMHSEKFKVNTHKTVILPVVLYGCGTWSLNLREEYKLREFENKKLRMIFGAKRDDVAGEWRCCMHFIPHPAKFILILSVIKGLESNYVVIVLFIEVINYVIM